MSLRIDVPAGRGWVIDTPGVRSFGLGHVDTANILKSFTDLDAIAQRCPRGCTHLPDAPDCAINEAVAAGELGETGRRTPRLPAAPAHDVLGAADVLTDVAPVREDGGMTEPFRLADRRHRARLHPPRPGRHVRLPRRLRAAARVIVYFYPEAMTPGCTTQACDFRDNLASLAGAGYQVLGVSKDAVAKLKQVPGGGLASPSRCSRDEDLAVHIAYGTWGEKNSYGRIVTGTLRSTFVIDEAGVISHALYNVKATGHISMLRKKLGIDA